MGKEGISIIIPTYNRVEALERTLKCISSSTLLPNELIVVDQSTKLEIREQIEGICASQKNPAIYEWHSEPSLTKARNAGMRRAKHEIIVFMDDDVDVKANTLEKLKELFSNPEVALVGGYDKKSVAKNSILSYIFGKASYTKRNEGHMTNAIYGRLPLSYSKNVITEWAMGFFFAVRKSCCDAWSCCFDEHLCFYAYAEDLDFTYNYCCKARAAKMKCIYDSRITVSHMVSQEYRTPTRLTTYMEYAHRYYIMCKYFPKNKKYMLCYLWSLIGDICYRTLKNNNVVDVFSAISFLRKNLKDIQEGCFHYDYFK